MGSGTMAVRRILVALLVSGGEPSQFLDPSTRQSSLQLLLPSLRSDNNQVKTPSSNPDTRPHNLFRPRIQATNNDIRKNSPLRGTTLANGQSSRTPNSIARLRQTLRRPQAIATKRPIQRTRIATSKRPTTRTQQAVTNSGRNRSLLRSPLERSQNVNRTNPVLNRSSFRRNPARPRFGQRIPIERPRSTRPRESKLDGARNLVGDNGNNRRLANIKKKLAQRKPILRRTNQERKKKVSQVSLTTTTTTITTETPNDKILNIENTNFELFDRKFGGAIPFTTIVPEATKESITSVREQVLESTTTEIPINPDAITEHSESDTDVKMQTTQEEILPTTQKEIEQTTQKEIEQITQKEIIDTTLKEIMPTTQKEIIQTTQKVATNSDDQEPITEAAIIMKTTPIAKQIKEETKYSVKISKS